ncbi:MAG: transposase [Verrucomicrobiota bacterium]
MKREREVLLQQALAKNCPLTWHEQKQLFDWYAERVDAYLDAGHGECWLKEPAVAALVAGALRFFEGQRYTLHAWVVMPNHVHAVLHPTSPHTLSSILKSWKGYTATQANRLLKRTGTVFWQNESYDHCCRDDEDRGHCCTYTTLNPVTARLCSRPEDWPWSSAHVGQTSGLPVPGVSDSDGPSEKARTVRLET